MPAHHLLHTGHTGHTGHPGDGLVDSLQQWRDADRAARPGTTTPALRVIDAHRATIDDANAALMRRYKLDSLHAFTVLVHWARLTHTPVHVVAERLVHGAPEADPWTVTRDRRLIRWLERQLLEPEPSSSELHGNDRSRQAALS